MPIAHLPKAQSRLEMRCASQWLALALGGLRFNGREMS